MKSWSTFVKRHWFKGLLLVEAIVLILAVVRYVHDSKTLEHKHFEATDFELLSGDISEDWSYYFVSETGEGARHFILGPYCDLSRGSYRTTVHYDTTASATMSFCWMYSDEAQDKDILCDNRDLARDHSSISTNFYLTNTVRKLQCRIIFMDDGVLNFYGVDIDETMDFDNIVMAGLICILILIPVCILLIRRYRASGRKMSKQSKYILTGLVAVTLAACGPCFLNYAVTSHDYQFHAVRIEGIKDGWLAGQFPTRIQPTWFYGLGYAASVFYGDILLWPSAFLRLLGMPVQYCYQFLQILINVLTCVVTYHSLKRMVRNPYSALFGTAIYMLAPYRLENLFFRNAIGEASAMIFLPLVVYGMWLILTRDERVQSRKRKWLPLTFGMTGLLQTHILTFELVLLLLVITALIYIVRLFKERRILDLLKAAGASVLLNAWFLIPFLQFFTGAYKVTRQEPALIQKTGAYLNQMFMFRVDFDFGSCNQPLTEGIMNEMPLSIGFGFGVALVFVFAVIWANGRKNDSRLRTGLTLAILSVACILMASNLFPWDAISGLGRTSAKLVSSIQFVWRFLSPATILAVMATAFAADYAMEHLNGIKTMISMGVIATLIFLQGTFLLDSILGMTGPKQLYDIQALDLDYTSSGNEYLPEGTNLQECFANRDLTSTENTDISEVEINGTNISFRAVNNGTTDEIAIPLLCYPGYVARCAEDGQELELGHTDYQLLQVTLPEGFAGTVEICYQESLLWRLAGVVSLLTAAGLVLYPMIPIRRAKKNTQGTE